MHRMVNGTFVVEKEQVRMTVTEVPSYFTSQSVDERPWHILNGHDSKIMPLLQKEIDHGKANCTADPDDFAECLPLEKDPEGRDIVNVYIVFGTAPMWPDGWPDEYNYPTAEQRAERFAELADLAAAQQSPVVDLLNKNNQTIIEQDLGLNHISADVTVEFLPELEALDEVLFIESRNKFYALQLLESKQITGIEQAKYWGYSGSDTIVGIIDSGLDIVDGSYSSATKTATPKHRDLITLSATNDTKLNKIMDFYHGTNSTESADNYGDNPDDCLNHGTRIAGIISGTGSVNPAYSGYAPDSKINVYKTTKGCGIYNDRNAILKAIHQATAIDNVDVLNLSYGGIILGSSGADRSSQAADRAFRNGTAVVVSVGNAGHSDSSYHWPLSPAAAHNVLAVGSVYQELPDTRSEYSSYGGTNDGRIKPDLMAPVGTLYKKFDMVTTDLGTDKYAGVDSYYGVEGTSYAAPQVAGAIANIIEQYKRNDITLEPGRIYAMMLSQALGNRTGDDGLRMDNKIGAGIFNMRYNTMETHSGHVEVSGNDYATLQIDAPVDAERLTVALWWPESWNDEHNKVDLELYNRNSTKVAFSTAGSATGDSSSGNVPYGPVTQRLIVDDPDTDDDAYTIRIQADDIGTETQKVFYSYTFMLPNHPRP